MGLFYGPMTEKPNLQKLTLREMKFLRAYQDTGVYKEAYLKISPHVKPEHAGKAGWKMMQRIKKKLIGNSCSIIGGSVQNGFLKKSRKGFMPSHRNISKMNYSRITKIHTGEQNALSI